MTGMGWGEIAVLVIVGLFVFGPERLPKVIADVVRTVRTLRTQMTAITGELKDELSQTVDVDEIRRLDPRRDDEPRPADTAPGTGTATTGPEAGQGDAGDRETISSSPDSSGSASATRSGHVSTSPSAHSAQRRVMSAKSAE